MLDLRAVAVDDFAAVLKEARRQHGGSLRAVARAADVAPSFLSDLEHGRRGAQEAVARRLAAVFGADPETFALLASWERVPDIWRTRIRELEAELAEEACLRGVHAS